MVIFGWRRWVHILGSKIDQCLKCGTIGQHVLIRKSWWFSLFFVPLVLLRVQHGMACGTCGEWTGIPMLKMVRGIRAGRLPLQRVRPGFAVAEPDPWGRRPEVAEVMDPITRNPSPRASARYVSLWPILASLAVVALVAYEVIAPWPKTFSGQQIDTNLQSTYGTAHDCWDDGTGITGCRLQNGTVLGTKEGQLTVCYFNEPMPATETTLHCK